MLVPTVHHGKDTTHKSLETMCNARAWPHVGRAVQTDPTLLRYASAITEQTKGWELLAQKFDRFQTLRNSSQQHATTCNRVWDGRKHVTSNNVGNCWTTTSVCTGLCTLDFFYNKKKMLREVTVLVGLWCACSAVLRAKRVCVKTNMPEIVVFTVPSTCFYTVVPRYHEPLVKSRFHCITS